MRRRAVTLRSQTSTSAKAVDGQNIYESILGSNIRPLTAPLSQPEELEDEPDVEQPLLSAAEVQLNPELGQLEVNNQVHEDPTGRRLEDCESKGDKV